MNKTKKIRVKVKRRKLKLKNIFFFLLIVILIASLVYTLLNVKIKNIYIINNKIVSDKQIISDACLEEYPSYLLTLKKNIKSCLLKNNNYIKDVTVKKRFFKVFVTVTEHKILSVYNNKIILDDGSVVENIYDIKDYPIIINDISDIMDDYVYYFNKVDDTTLTKISQIEYMPNDVDKERFLLYMNDGNSVYITLTKIEKLNKYMKIVNQMDNKNGIIYLDSGDYIELK